MNQIWVWQFDPVAIALGPLAVHWYGLLFVGAFMIGQWMVRRIAIQEQQTRLDTDQLFMLVLGATIIGARLVHCLFYDPAYYLAHPLEILQIWRGGLASHGGAAGLLLVVWYYSRRHQLNFWWLTDRIALPSALGAAMVRVANFLNSEILGKPTAGDWGVVFTKVDQLPRHPVQLYEAASYLLVFGLLLILYRRYRAQTPLGLLTGLFLLLVFSARFALEFFKTPQAAYEAGQWLSVGQYLSLPVMAIGLWLVLTARKPQA